MYRKGFSSYHALHTRASTADADKRFFPILRPMEAAGVKALLVQGDIYDMTGDMLVEMGVQVSSDIENWPAASVFTRIVGTGASQATADGFFATPDFELVANVLTKAWFRAGFIVRNNSAPIPRIELCWGALRIDARAC
jgi:hypothetical protein